MRPMIAALTRAAAWLALLAIIVLSVVPGELRPHVMADKHYEHFTAYFITGCLFAVAYFQPRQLIMSGVMLATCAGALEIVQLWIAGRTSSLGDFASSACGAWLGLGLVCLLRYARARTAMAQSDQDL